MEDGFAHLLTAYEKGKLTRRQLLASLVVASTTLSAQVSSSPLRGRARNINHINVRVSNLPRSAAFYAKLGLPSTLRPIIPPIGQAAYALDFQDGSLLSLIQTPESDRVGTIDHFCIGLDNFDRQRDTEAIRAAGIDVPAAPLDAPESEWLFVRDPDGVSVQISDAKQIYECPAGIGNPPCAPV